VNVIAGLRIPLDNPIGVAILAILIGAAATGIFFWVLSSLMDYIILPILRVPKDKRGTHLLNRIVSVLTLVLAVGLVFLFVLPACGINLLGFTVENIYPIGILD
jgi:nitrogen fixation/metabolism regulation signal transduction histidine kinase